MLNLTIVEGRITADPTLTVTDKSRYCRFTIACDRPKRKDEAESQTDFFQCIAFETTAEFISKWFHKGDKMTVVGRIENSRYEKNGEKHTSTSIKVREVHFGSPKKKDENADNSVKSASPEFYDFEKIPDDENVPF